MSGKDDDSAVWRSVTADVKPLRKRNESRDPVGIQRSDTETIASTSTGLTPVPRRRPSEPLTLGKAPGVDRRTAERLRRGQLPIEARLDLHGHTRETAHRALTGFLGASWEAGRRVVLVVTGKGQGVLKDAVPRWLNEAPNRGRILLVAQAQPKHGGGGALYVLLRRRR